MVVWGQLILAAGEEVLHEGPRMKQNLKLNICLPHSFGVFLNDTSKLGLRFACNIPYYVSGEGIQEPPCGVRLSSPISGVARPPRAVFSFPRQFIYICNILKGTHR